MAAGFPPSIMIGGSAPGAAPQGAMQDNTPDGDPEVHLHAALDALSDYMKDEQDHSDKTVAAKCIAALQGILGARQKGAESALGVTPAHKAMSRSYGG